MSPLVNVVTFVGAGALWLAAAGLPPDDQTIAAWMGRLIFHLVAAALIVWIYNRKQEPRPPFWSPWLFLVAAGIALLERFGSG